ncbi:replication endonuclease [Lonepinella sp. BR2271]|uniref:replication endonuclease n=1 Tax=Lonepinella sp. BR2271 TaxID=3434550 RepID=UPI003F6DBC32
MSWQAERDENERLKAERGMVRQQSPYVVCHTPPESARTESQLELFASVPYSYGYVERWLDSLPRKRLREHFRKLYLKKYRSVEIGGERLANTWIREVVGKRLKKVFRQYKVDLSWLLSFEQKSPDFRDFLKENGQAIFENFNRTFNADAPVEQWTADEHCWQAVNNRFNRYVHREIAKGSLPFYLLTENKMALMSYELSLTFAKLQQAFIDDQLAKQQAFSPSEIDSLMLEIYAECGRACASIGFPLKHWDSFQRRGTVKQESIEVILAKICDERHWLRLMKRKQRQMIEHIAIACGEVRKQFSSYISKQGLSEWKMQQKKNYDFLKAMILENVEDPAEQQELLAIVMKSDSNPTNRRHLMMTMLNGVEQWAEESGHEALFLTLTAPSGYHATLFNGQDNPKWYGTSPKQTNAYLNGVWAKVRALLAKRGIGFYGMRVAEPHHDATPHWHLLMYVQAKDKADVIEIFRTKALEVDGTERGAKEHRFKVEEIDREKGSATAYVAKYIAKNVDGFADDDEVSDEDPNMKLKDNAKRARAWASLWGIRQFQFYGVSSVGVWRELRRLTKGDLNDDELEELRVCADVGCYASYLKRQGGAMVKRKDQAVRLHYQETEPNKFGETRQKIDGVRLSRCLDWVKTRLKQWAIKRKAKTQTESEPTPEMIGRSDPNKGDFIAPRTCVSNCNRPQGREKVRDVVQFMNEHRNEVELIQFWLKLKQISSRWITDYRICRLILGEKLGIYGGMSIYWNGQEVVLV